MLLLEKLRQRLIPNQFDREVQRFYADGGETVLRYDYLLDTASVILDLGGYHGDWTAKIHERYGSTIHVFEPVAAYADLIRARFIGNRKISVHQFALGSSDRWETISLQADGSSAFRASAAIEPIQVVEMAAWLHMNGVDDIALIKLNIEGGEYEVLEHMIERGIHRRCRNIQVQFHDLFPDAEARMNRIGGRLAETHHLTYDYKFVWQNWTRT